MLDIVEKWKNGERSHRWWVEVSGKDCVVYAYGYGPGNILTWTKFHPIGVGVNVRWPIGSYEGTIRIGIWAKREGKPKMDPIELKPGQLREIPSWLLDIITRAVPRDIDWPDIEPHPEGWRYGG